MAHHTYSGEGSTTSAGTVISDSANTRQEPTMTSTSTLGRASAQLSLWAHLASTFASIRLSTFRYHTMTIAWERIVAGSFMRIYWGAAWSSARLGGCLSTTDGNFGGKWSNFIGHVSAFTGRRYTYKIYMATSLNHVLST